MRNKIVTRVVIAIFAALAPIILSESLVSATAAYSGESYFHTPTNSATQPTEITLTGTIRDFKAKGTTGGHDDFERINNVDINSRGQTFKYGADRNIVTNTLDTDKKPVFGSGTYSTTSKENFDQWYRDVSGVNQSKTYKIQLNDSDRDGIYTYDNSSFFPIDNELFGNQSRSHNYHFTYEMQGKFKYKTGQKFKFRGDDDVWVYINGMRVIDIGGVHGAESAEVNLDTLGLTPNQIYPLNFFFAERHTSQSNFKIETSLAFVPVTITITSPDRTSDLTPVISGTSEPNNKITLGLDTDKNGVTDIVYQTTTDSKGKWAVDVETANPLDSVSKPTFKLDTSINVKAQAKHSDDDIYSDIADQTVTFAKID